MRKVLLLIMLNGSLILLPKYVFCDPVDMLFYISNLSTIESVVLYHNPSAGSGWYHCPYDTGDGIGPNRYVVPPMTTVKILFVSNFKNMGYYLAQNVQLWSQLPDSLLPKQPIYQKQNEAMLYGSCSSSNGYCPSSAFDLTTVEYQLVGSETNLPYAFWDTQGQLDSTNTGGIAYISNLCPYISDASNMLNNNYASGACPKTPPTIQQDTFPDIKGRPWGITCSNNNVPDSKKDPLTVLKSVKITVSPYSDSHRGFISCNYGYTDESVAATFTYANDNVLLPTDGVARWATTPGGDPLSGTAICDDTYGSPEACQWAEATNSY